MEKLVEKKITLNNEVILNIPKHFKDLPDGKYSFGIRASGVTIDKSGFPFQIELAEISGSETFLHLNNDQIHLSLIHISEPTRPY